MPITIYGAGAIGGLTGAYLARSGEDVLLVDKVVAHVEAMNHQGLRITGADNFTVPVRACLPEDLSGPLEMILLAVKSQDTDAALEVISPRIATGTVLVSLQNGMNPPRIAERIGARHVVGAFVDFGADWQGPGHIEHGGPGDFYVGEIDGSLSGRLYQLRDLLRCLHPVTVTSNIFGYLWSKQILTALLFAQAVTNETMADLYSDKRFQPLLVGLLGEGVSVARAAGVKLERVGELELLKMQPKNDAELLAACEVLDGYAMRYRNRLKVRSGPWRDLAIRKRPTELDHLMGWVITEAKKYGIPMPLSDRLAAQVKEIEQGRRQLGIANLEQLADFRTPSE